MTNKEKAEKNTALASEPAEFSGELADDDLKQVAGGGIANPEAAGLSAYGVNGILTVKGLTAGEPFSVHNAQGILIYRGVTQGDETTIAAPVKGVYFVTSADKTLKVLNN